MSLSILTEQIHLDLTGFRRDQITTSRDESNLILSLQGDSSIEILNYFSNRSRIQVIYSDSPVVSLSALATSLPENITVDDEEVASEFTFTVALDQGSILSDTASVLWRTVDGSADATQDFLFGSGEITFVQGGPLIAEITVSTVADSIKELDETFEVELYSLNGGIVFPGGADSISEQLTILNDDLNEPPLVNAGEDLEINQYGTFLSGSVSDDGLPEDIDALSVAWSVVRANGQVTFGSEFSPQTSVTFSAEGTYVLQLSASDGLASTVDEVTVEVGDSLTEYQIVLSNAPYDPSNLSFQNVALNADFQFDSGLIVSDGPVFSWDMNANGLIDATEPVGDAITSNLTISGGRFNLFAEFQGVEWRNSVNYRATVASIADTEAFFEGFSLGLGETSAVSSEVISLPLPGQANTAFLEVSVSKLIGLDAYEADVVGRVRFADGTYFEERSNVVEGSEAFTVDWDFDLDEDGDSTDLNARNTWDSDDPNLGFTASVTFNNIDYEFTFDIGFSPDGNRLRFIRDRGTNTYSFDRLPIDVILSPRDFYLRVTADKWYGSAPMTPQFEARLLSDTGNEVVDQPTMVWDFPGGSSVDATGRTVSWPFSTEGLNSVTVRTTYQSREIFLTSQVIIVPSYQVTVRVRDQDEVIQTISPEVRSTGAIPSITESAGTHTIEDVQPQNSYEVVVDQAAGNS